MVAEFLPFLFWRLLFRNLGNIGSRENQGLLSETPRGNTDVTQQFSTPEGEVYGFVDKDGNIYLDEDVISPEQRQTMSFK